MEPCNAPKIEQFAIDRQPPTPPAHKLSFLAGIWGVMAADSKRAQGLLFILLVAIIWVAASFLVKEIVAEGLKPLILTYIANSLFAICLPAYFFKQWLQRGWSRTHGEKYERISSLDEHCEDPAEAEGMLSAASEDAQNAAPIDPIELHVPQEVYSHKQTFMAALVVAPLWFLAQLTFNLSLSATSVTSNTILSSTSSLFTFGLSVWLLGEAFTIIKLLSIVTCMAGTAMVTIGDSKATPPSDGAENTMTAAVGGDLLALLSAMLYAAYTLSIRLRLPDDDKVSMLLFFGYVGIINLTAVAPVILTAQLVGWVDIRLVPLHAFGLTVVKGLFDNVLSDYLWARAVLLIGPTLATVGLSIQVPITVVAEVIFTHPAYLQHAGSAVLVLVGGALVLAGFFGINLAQMMPSAA